MCLLSFSSLTRHFDCLYQQGNFIKKITSDWTSKCGHESPFPFKQFLSDYRIPGFNKSKNFTLSLNSISALYPVFSQFIVTTPPNSMVSVPIKIPTVNKCIYNKCFKVVISCRKYTQRHKLAPRVKCTQSKICQLKISESCVKFY